MKLQATRVLADCTDSGVSTLARATSCRADLQRHTDDFGNRKGFTYTVLDPASRDVIGCVYIYPLPDSDHDACILSWVRQSYAHLDTPLWRAVSEWLDSDWPLASIEYAPRT